MTAVAAAGAGVARLARGLVESRPEWFWLAESALVIVSLNDEGRDGAAMVVFVTAADVVGSRSSVGVPGVMPPRMSVASCLSIRTS
jgi:hypothetical protein